MSNRTLGGSCATSPRAKWPPWPRSSTDQAPFPYEIVAKLGELGLMGIPYPEEVGGGGADNLSYALAIEELARVDSSVAITVAAHTSLGTWPLYAFGSDAQKEEAPASVLRRAARGLWPDRAGGLCPTPGTPAPAQPPRTASGW